jgi:hypothetical protein
MKKPAPLLHAIFAAFLFSCPLQAGVTIDAGAAGVARIEVTSSMLGLRDTLRFYVFEDAKAVLRVQIDNKNTKFPVSGKLYVFAKDASAEGIKNWINNQHSDGLFPDVPEPTSTHEIPAAACKSTSHERVKDVEGGPSGIFTRYNVKFEIKDVPAFGDIKIKDFTDTAAVHVKIQAG